MRFSPGFALPELPSETRTGPSLAFWGTARGRRGEGYGGMVIADVGGWGVWREEEEEGGEEA